MQSTRYKAIELLLLFVIIPITLAIDISVWLKLCVGVVGFIYLVFILLRIENVKFEIIKGIQWQRFLRQTFIKLIVILVLTTLYMGFVDPNNLFVVILNKPLLWVIILFVYSIFSVYPQELIYRTFFFKRYQPLFKDERVFILLNALLFSLAHLFFMNTLVLILTFLGGILFAITFKKTKSTLLVSIEHAIYGCWLFTVGMGDMLGFPS